MVAVKYRKHIEMWNFQWGWNRPLSLIIWDDCYITEKNKRCLKYPHYYVDQNAGLFLAQFMIERHWAIIIGAVTTLHSWSYYKLKNLHIVKDSINALPGKSSVNTVQQETIDRAVFSMPSAPRPALLMDKLTRSLTRDTCILCGLRRATIKELCFLCVVCAKRI
jgi:hypothetical protein